MGVGPISDSEGNMPAFIRYPLLGCVILALSACGGSGSSRLLEDPSQTMDETPAPPTPALYPGVKYLIMDIDAAIAKFAPAPPATQDPSGGTDQGTTTNVCDPSAGACPAQGTGANHSFLRDSVVGLTSRYLSTGGVLIGKSVPPEFSNPEFSNATCTDATATDPAQCVFGADRLRSQGATFYFGRGSPNVSFMADRQPVMLYRDVLMSQVRTADREDVDVYEDGDGNKYLLTSANVTGMNLTDVDLPMGVTTAPNFADLLAVYQDAENNRYLLTPTNVANMDLMGVELPTGVSTAPDFSSLSKVMESRVVDDENYVGYDGILKYSMFFVGVDRFYDADGPTDLRLGHASLGQIYDEDDGMGGVLPGIQQPTVSLTGAGVMVGVESQVRGLEHYLVQGDVNIDYSPFVAEDMANMVDEMAAMVDISITNIQRLNDDGDSWYANNLGVLDWDGLEVTDSEFSYMDIQDVNGEMTRTNRNPATASSKGDIQGSFYGTQADPEVGGVFHHAGPTHQIIGSFGSRLSEPAPTTTP